MDRLHPTRICAWGVLILCGTLLTLAAANGGAPEAAQAQRPPGFAYSIELKGPILREAEAELQRGLMRAEARHASVVIVRLDTPGGLADVTRQMSKEIIAARTPVIVYVNPAGAAADSAGVFLVLSGDVAAMTPGTNIGSATPYRFPVSGRGEAQQRVERILERKARNDFIAFARALAETHDRNGHLAGQMVSEAVNVSAATARRKRVIDVVASDERSLLQKVDGFRVTGPKAQVLHTAGLPIKHANVVEVAIDTGETGDHSSLVKSLVLIVGAALAIVLIVFAAVRGQQLWRRRRWLWRRYRAKRQRPRRE